MKTTRQKFIVVDENHIPMVFDTDQFYKVKTYSVKTNRKVFKHPLECYDLDELSRLFSEHQKFRIAHNFSPTDIRIIPIDVDHYPNLSHNSYNKAIQTLIEDLSFNDNDECIISKHFLIKRIIPFLEKKEETKP